MICMGKKTAKKKLRLGKKLKQSRRIPLLTIVRTHRKIEQNIFRRDWRHRKLKIKNEE